VIEHKEPVDAVAGSLVVYLGRCVHLVEVVGGSGNGEWVVGKWIVKQEMIGTWVV
jgi:hypothetical protein